MTTYIYYGDSLYHHGILGQKWGIRRYQNEDGSLTAAGREHYGYGAKAAYKERVGKAKANYKEALVKSVKANSDSKGNMTKDQIKKFDTESKKLGKKLNAEKKAAKEEYKNSDEYKARQQKIKKAAIAGAAIAATALAAYGAYKVSEATKKKAYNLSIERGKKAASDIVDRLHTENIRTGMKDKLSRLRGFERSFETDNENTARYNSRNLKSAIEYLHGSGRLTAAELEKSGIRTMDINRDLSDELDLMNYRRLRANDELENVRRYNNYTKEVRRINGKKYK